jgi:hypothetical protein
MKDKLNWKFKIWNRKRILEKKEKGKRKNRKPPLGLNLPSPRPKSHFTTRAGSLLPLRCGPRVSDKPSAPRAPTDVSSCPWCMGPIARFPLHPLTHGAACVSFLLWIGSESATDARNPAMAVAGDLGVLPSPPTNCP